MNKEESKSGECIGYRIAGIHLKLHMPWKEMVSEAFRPFLWDGGDADWHIDFLPVKELAKETGKLMFENTVFRAYEKAPGVFVRQYHNDRADGSPYAAVTANAAIKRVQVEYLPEAEEKFGTGEADFFCIALEKILLEEQAMVLHAACVETPYGGILFAGNSGVGKSTQADLWCRWGDGKLLNGDRPILKETQEGFCAYGSPYAGSSGCHVNERCPVRSIVFVKQAEDCRLRVLKGSEKFRKIFGNLTVNLWDEGFVREAGHFAERLMEEIPVYEYCCTREKEAVFVLKEFLEKELKK